MHFKMVNFMLCVFYNKNAKKSIEIIITVKI